MRIQCPLRVGVANSYLILALHLAAHHPHDYVPLGESSSKVAANSVQSSWESMSYELSPSLVRILWSASSCVILLPSFSDLLSTLRSLHASNRPRRGLFQYILINLLRRTILSTTWLIFTQLQLVLMTEHSSFSRVVQ